MKSLILISSILMLFFPQAPKKVYILKGDNTSLIQYNAQKKEVNLHIDSAIVKDEKLQNGVKLYIASYFVQNREKLVEDFTVLYKKSLSCFALQHKKEISNVIYYLEHVDHGNLPLVYGKDAYVLLNIRELKPVITSVSQELHTSGMYLIDVKDTGKAKDVESIRNK